LSFWGREDVCSCVSRVYCVVRCRNGGLSFWGVSVLLFLLLKESSLGALWARMEGVWFHWVGAPSGGNKDL